MSNHLGERFHTELFQADVCIIGSGPAGLTLARELASTSLRIILLETGGTDPAPPSLSSGTVDSPHGYPAAILSEGRRRQLGGSANLWNHEPRGQSEKYIRCVPLDEADFEKRDWLPYSGWPFSREDLLPSYERAQAAFGLGDFAYTADGWHDERNHPRPIETDALHSSISEFALPDRFTGDVFAELAGHINIHLLADTHLQRLDRDPLTHRITTAHAITTAGQPLQISATHFILAGGTFENARILLLNDHEQPGGLGNQHDMVGRCFMDHPSITLGTLHPADPGFFDSITFYDQHLAKGRQIMGKLQVRPEVRAREQLLNLYSVLVPRFRDLRSNLPLVARELLEKGPGFLSRHRPHLGHDAPAIVHEAPASLHRRLLEGYYSECFCGWSKLENKSRRFGDCGVRSLVETVPDPANRITLGDQIDRFGQRRLHLQWRWNELDLASIARTQEIFRNAFAEAGLGRFEPVPTGPAHQPRDFHSTHHFMGTTRMHHDPRQGVVDADCRVHGVPNLFLAGSSVFPTGGCANPTLTLVALAIRLADHLKRETATPAANLSSGPVGLTH